MSETIVADSLEDEHDPDETQDFLRQLSLAQEDVGVVQATPMLLFSPPGQEHAKRTMQDDDETDGRDRVVRCFELSCNGPPSAAAGGGGGDGVSGSGCVRLERLDVDASGPACRGEEASVSLDALQIDAHFDEAGSLRPLSSVVNPGRRHRQQSSASLLPAHPNCRSDDAPVDQHHVHNHDVLVQPSPAFVTTTDHHATFMIEDTCPQVGHETLILASDIDDDDLMDVGKKSLVQNDNPSNETLKLSSPVAPATSAPFADNQPTPRIPGLHSGRSVPSPAFPITPKPPSSRTTDIAPICSTPHLVTSTHSIPHPPSFSETPIQEFKDASLSQTPWMSVTKSSRAKQIDQDIQSQTDTNQPSVTAASLNFFNSNDEQLRKLHLESVHQPNQYPQESSNEKMDSLDADVSNLPKSVNCHDAEDVDTLQPAVLRLEYEATQEIHDESADIDDGKNTGEKQELRARNDNLENAKEVTPVKRAKEENEKTSPAEKELKKFISFLSQRPGLSSLSIVQQSVPSPGPIMNSLARQHVNPEAGFMESTATHEQDTIPTQDTVVFQQNHNSSKSSTSIHEMLDRIRQKSISSTSSAASQSPCASEKPLPTEPMPKLTSAMHTDGESPSCQPAPLSVKFRTPVVSLDGNVLSAPLIASETSPHKFDNDAKSTVAPIQTMLPQSNEIDVDSNDKNENLEVPLPDSRPVRSAFIKKTSTEQVKQSLSIGLKLPDICDNDSQPIQRRLSCKTKKVIVDDEMDVAISDTGPILPIKKSSLLYVRSSQHSTASTSSPNRPSKLTSGLVHISQLISPSTHTWRVGEIVWAQWPNDTFFYPATIESISSSFVTVVYHDGTRKHLSPSSLSRATLQPGDTCAVQSTLNRDVYREAVVTASKCGRFLVVTMDEAGEVLERKIEEMCLSEIDFERMDKRQRFLERFDDADRLSTKSMRQERAVGLNVNEMPIDRENCESYEATTTKNSLDMEMCVDVKQSQTKKRRRQAGNRSKTMKMSPPIKRGRLSLSSSSSSPKKQDGCFLEGYQFLVTSITQESDKKGKRKSCNFKDADAVSCAIISLGGDILDIEMYEKSKNKRGCKSTILLASSMCRTTKYFLALAGNIPRLSVEWLQACLDQFVPFDSYYLDNGLSTDKQVIPFFNQGHIFAKQLLYLFGHGISSEQREHWGIIIRAAGGQIAPKRNSAKIDVFVCFGTNSDSETFDKAAITGKLVVAKEWLCQCLIQQNLVEHDNFLIKNSG